MAEIVTPDKFTRRDFARLASLTFGGFAAAPLVAQSGHECATGLRRGLAARMGAMSGGGGGMPTAKDYVQDGLIAMWDGIENAGWGTHDTTATTWKDLVGSHDLTYSPGTSISNNGCHNGSEAIATKENNISWGMTEAVITPVFSKIGEEVVVVANGSTNAGGLLLMAGGNNTEAGSTSKRLIAFNSAWRTCALISENYEFISGSTISISTSPMIGGISKAYKNGQSVTCYSATGNGYYIHLFSVGGSGMTTGRVFKGTIHTIRLYDRELTDEKIAANYAIDKARFGLA